MTLCLTGLKYPTMKDPALHSSLHVIEWVGAALATGLPPQLRRSQLKLISITVSDDLKESKILL